MINVVINGFGRIGRNTLRNILARKHQNIQIVAINDIGDPATLAHLFKYDSVHGPFAGSVEVQGSHLVINRQKVQIFS